MCVRMCFRGGRLCKCLIVTWGAARRGYPRWGRHGPGGGAGGNDLRRGRSTVRVADRGEREREENGKRLGRVGEGVG